MKTYYLRGTISVRVDGTKTTLRVTPAAGFLTPGKSPNAIALLLDTKTKLGSGKVERDYALGIGLDDEKSFQLDAKAIKSHMPALLAIAGQQKLAELYLDEDKGATPPWKFCGFQYPAP